MSSPLVRTLRHPLELLTAVPSGAGIAAQLRGTGHHGRHRRPTTPVLELHRTRRALPTIVAVTIIVGLAAVAVPQSHASQLQNPQPTAAHQR